MLPVPVPTTRPASREALDEMVEKLDGVFNQIRRTAFDSFLRRGQGFGSELEDWFQAERELFRLPEAEMKDTGEAFEIRAAVPGFAAEALQVQVLPELIIIEGTAEEKSAPGEVIFSEFRSQRMFRQFRLAAPVEAEKVVATLDKGILTVVAPKRQMSVEGQKGVSVPVATEVIKAPPTALVAAAAGA